MSTLIQRFLAARSDKQKPPLVTNGAEVTRAEFNTLARAVEILINELSDATSPEKLRSVLNAALDEAKPATNSGRSHLAPGARRPLALKSDRAALAPQGD